MGVVQDDDRHPSVTVRRQPLQLRGRACSGGKRGRRAVDGRVRQILRSAQIRMVGEDGQVKIGRRMQPGQLAEKVPEQGATLAGQTQHTDLGEIHRDRHLGGDRWIGSVNP